MTVQRQILYWTTGIVGFVAVLYLLRGVLLPFVAGLVLAYLLDPMADRLERIGLGRVAATGIIVGAAVLAFAVALVVLVPLLGEQLARLAALVPTAVAAVEALLEDPNSWLSRIVGDEISLDGQMTAIVREAIGWLAAVFRSVWSGGMALLGVVSLLVVTPVVAFYLLVDWDRMVADLDEWLPRDHAATIRRLMAEIDRAMAGFLRGQGLVCLILAVFYSLALSLAGLSFGLLIGVTAGAISFIPYVGSIVGMVLSVGMAIGQTWPAVDWLFVGVVGAIFFAGQMAEGNFLSPRLIGASVGLHPVALMFALFAFGYLFGFVGMLLAVPAAAAIGVVLRFLLGQYLHSRLYLGSGRSRSRGPGGDAAGDK
jgi:predicted PurR-regulated permease PerM